MRIPKPVAADRKTLKGIRKRAAVSRSTAGGNREAPVVTPKPAGVIRKTHAGIRKAVDAIHEMDASPLA